MKWMRSVRLRMLQVCVGCALVFALARSWGVTNVYLVEVPDYSWYYGCMGTAAGNLAGYWDRHGFPGLYTGPCDGGLAPLDTSGTHAAIVSLWASAAGQDGRPSDQPGHVDDYYSTYGVTGDPYLEAGRSEHAPDCLGDFIGLSQWKWPDLGGECAGNLDGYSFVYWDTNGERRVNYVPEPPGDEPAVDVQSGLRAWTRYRGYDATVFTQLADFNPTKPAGRGFTFADLKNEIEQGYPVLLFLQKYGELSRDTSGVTNANPGMHSMLAYGYYVYEGGSFVRYRTSWASGNNMMRLWDTNAWEAGLPLRGVIGYHPLPKITSCALTGQDLLLQWDGPASLLYSSVSGATSRVQGFVVEMASSLSASSFAAVSGVLRTNAFLITNCPAPAYFRVSQVRL